MFEYSSSQKKVSNRPVEIAKAWLYFIVGMAVASNGVEIAVGAGTLTPERLLAFPLWLFALFLSLNGRARWPQLTAPLLSIWLLSALLSSIVSPVPEWSIKMWVALFIAASYYFFAIVLKVDVKKFFLSKVFFLIVLFYGAVSPFIYFYGLFGGSGAELWLQEGSGGLRLRGLVTEANLFGVFLVLPMLVLIALKGWFGRLYWLLLGGLSISMVLSFSRAPWISYFFAYAVYRYLSFPRKITTQTLGRAVPVVVSVIVFAFLGWVFFADFVSDFELVSRTNTIDARLVMWDLALGDIVASPLLGTGVFSFSEMYPNAPSEVGSDSYRSAWISNIFLAIVHDTGIVGAVLFSMFFLSLLLRGVKVVRRSAVQGGDVSEIKLGAALLASSLAFLVSGQSIPAHSLAFFWITLGLTDRQIVILSRKINRGR